MSALRDGDETFPAMLESIRRARHYVHLETYIFEADGIGETFGDVLRERAEAGITVRLLIDGFGSLFLSGMLSVRMQRAGVQIVRYRGAKSKRGWPGLLRRDHRKILVIDGERAFVGGINIGRQYVPASLGGEGWRDTHLQIEGPAVADLEAMFRDTWHIAGGNVYAPYAREADESVAGPGSEYACAVASDDRGRRSTIRRHLTHAIRSARDSIYIANAYFIPDRGLRRALTKAARRGVDVQLIVPAESDIKLVQWAGEHTYAQLLRSGISIHQWQHVHMHAKSVVVDGVWFSIGSYNLDYVSLFRNLEVVVEGVGRDTGMALVKMFEKDKTFCHTVDRRSWKERRWWLRALQWLAYRFRRWL